MLKWLAHFLYYHKLNNEIDALLLPIFLFKSYSLDASSYDLDKEDKICNQNVAILIALYFIIYNIRTDKHFHMRFNSTYQTTFTPNNFCF